MNKQSGDISGFLYSIDYFCDVIPSYISSGKLTSFIREAIREDLGEGDHTTLAVIPGTKEGSAILVAKEDGIIAGLELTSIVFHEFDRNLIINFYKKDGDKIEAGNRIFSVEGRARSILSAERLVLNFIQRMSGIATYTNNLTGRLSGYHAKLLDTRKTTPNFRIFEKWAVKIGGGENHRLGLYDMILLKDNHIDMAGGIRNAILMARKYLQEKGLDLPVEVETRNLQEVQEAIDTGNVDIIMLDNMKPDAIKEAVRMTGGKMKTEASGNITQENIRSIAACGVDYISVGALTHSAKGLDVTLKTQL